MSPRKRIVGVKRSAALIASHSKVARMSSGELQRTVHELQVRQIESKRENAELRAVNAGLAQSRDHFSDLYDMAPAGCVTRDPDGSIIEANLTLAAMLGVARSMLVGRKITRFLGRGGRDAFFLHRRVAIDGGGTQACELPLRRHDGTTGKRCSRGSRPSASAHAVPAPSAPGVR